MTKGAGWLLRCALCAWLAFPSLAQDPTTDPPPSEEPRVDVQVVDFTGRPAAGACVGIYRSNPWMPEGLEVLSACSDARGLLALDLSQLSADSRHSTTEHEFFARLATPALYARRVPLSELRARGAATFRLPACGAVEVRLDPASPLAELPADCLLIADLEERDEQGARIADRWGPSVSFVDGVARFPHVGVGVPLRAVASCRGELIDAEMLSPGLTRVGETLRLVVRYPEVAECSGRLLDAEGRPLVEQSLRVRRERRDAGASSRMTSTLHTGPDGAFRLFLPIPGTWRLVFAGGGGEDDAIGHSLGPLREAGRRELGDLRLPAAEVVASGRVVDTRGAPLAGVEVEVLRSTGQSRPPLWVHDTGMKAITDEEGRFELRGPEAAAFRRRADGGFGLRARAEGWLATAVPPFPETGVEARIVLARPGRLSLPVPRLPGDHDRAAPLEWSLLPRFPTIGISVPQAADHHPPGRAEFGPLPPGRYDAALWWCGRVLAWAEGIELAEGGITRDARVEAMAQDPPLRCCRVSVVSELGAEHVLRDADVQLSNHGGGLARSAPKLPDGAFSVLTPLGSPVPVQVVAHGHQARKLVVDADVEVVLSPRILVEVAIRGLPCQLSPRARVTVLIEPAGAPLGARTVSDCVARPGPGVEVHVVDEAGLHEICWYVAIQKRHTDGTVLTGILPLSTRPPLVEVTADPRDQRFEVLLDEKVRAEALRIASRYAER